MLKRRLDELTKKTAMIQTTLAGSQEQSKISAETQKELMEKMQVLVARLARASKVAAYMEKQIKDAKPNAKIDYHVLSEIEPSTQLLAALLARDVPVPGGKQVRQGGAVSSGSE
jgi:hypothetical protein